MLEATSVLYIAALTIFVYVSLLYIISILRKDSSIMDVGWGLGFVLISFVLMNALHEKGLYDNNNAFKIVMAAVVLWGTRLFIHILRRKAGEKEDWRYQKMRTQWGASHWWRSYFQVFILQGLLLIIISLPLLISATKGSSTQLNPLLTLAGASIWTVGYYFEVIGDWQLSKFLKKRQANSTKKNKKTKQKNSIMKSGLWKYTRHPNYFGEITQWWGLFIIVLQLDGGIFGILSPLLITYLLLKVSGITMLEKKYEDNKEFQKYKKKTSALIPLPPKK